ncbi:unnamed protein product [Polarella glacialis]|uniref:Cytosolic Fe-S cluster assembly factor NUBP1 homolog n=1 Tax=Polarella glacialis TaxID=89957 RepID=A0A813KWC2_POLGL|nr:unnamed protein product [Polarella glacialis]
MDREISHCPFGVISVLFFFVKYLIEGDSPKLSAARSYFSLLDAMSSGMHPHLLDRADWLVTDARISSLRRVVLGRLRPRNEPSRKPLVFVYDKETPEVRELSQGASFCAKGQWGMEVHIHEWLLASHHLTNDPDEADFFFVPAYSICMFEGGFFPMDVLDEKYTQMVRSLPYFKRNRGRDHIFTFGSGLSANVFRSWRREIPNSIQLSPETWLFNDAANVLDPPFDTWRDIAIPGYLHRHEVISLTQQARPLAKREHLAVFLGRIDPSRGSHPGAGGTDVRGAIRRLQEKGKVFVAQNLSMPEMHAVMGNSRFCFVPKGKSAWSLRFYESLFANCVPVVLSDFWELPFESFLDLPSFVIKWPMDKVGDRLMEYLEALSDEVLEEYMEASRRSRCWYVFPPLLHELEQDEASDELLRICPTLKEENAFQGLTRILGALAQDFWKRWGRGRPPGNHLTMSSPQTPPYGSWLMVSDLSHSSSRPDLRDISHRPRGDTISSSGTTCPHVSDARSVNGNDRSVVYSLTQVSFDKQLWSALEFPPPVDARVWMMSQAPFASPYLPPKVGAQLDGPDLRLRGPPATAVAMDTMAKGLWLLTLRSAAVAGLPPGQPFGSQASPGRIEASDPAVVNGSDSRSLHVNGSPTPTAPSPAAEQPQSVSVDEPAEAEQKVADEEKPADANEDCVGVSSEAAGKAAGCSGCPNQSACASGEAKKKDPAVTLIKDRLSNVKRKILVLSGKGGVGKSTISAQLSFGFAAREMDVGLLDVDICGPSVPRMLGLLGQDVHQSSEGWSPVYVDDHLAVMSIGFMLPNQDDAIIWRGPRKNGLIKQFLTDVNWGPLDVMLIDTPPGTSDEHLSIVTYLQDSSVDGAVIVTTPQEVSLMDVRKEINFCRKVKLPIIGVVENMSGYACTKCGHEERVFAPSTGGAREMCKLMEVPFLGSVPLDSRVAAAGDSGMSMTKMDPQGPVAKCIDSVITAILKETDKSGGAAAPSLQ